MGDPSDNAVEILKKIGFPTNFEDEDLIE